ALKTSNKRLEARNKLLERESRQKTELGSEEKKRLGAKFEQRVYQGLSASFEDEKEELKNQLQAEYMEKLAASEEEKTRMANEIASLQSRLKDKDSDSLAYSRTETKALRDEIEALMTGKEKLQQQLNDTSQTLSKVTTTVIENQARICDLNNQRKIDETKIAGLEKRLEEESGRRKDTEEKLQRPQVNRIPSIPAIGASVMPNAVLSQPQVDGRQSVIKEETH
ncbi:MAG: hypothetical protein SGARI_007436, partial [Bacillariaceae sp.]